MQRRQTVKYILFDLLAALLSWTALFLFRKSSLEHVPLDGSILAAPKLWLGLMAVPAGWIILYTLQGSYRNVLRKARVKELLDTMLATVIGVVAIFFLLLVDDHVTSYAGHYRAFLFLLGTHFLLTYVPRMLITSQTAHMVHTRCLGFPSLMIGSKGKAFQTYLDLENQETYSGNLFVGFVTVNGSIEPQLQAVMPHLGSIEDLRQLIDRHGVEEVIIAVEDHEREKINEILRALNTCGDLIIKITPDARDLIIGSIRQESIFHSPFIVINNRLMAEWQYSVKRIADIVISLVAMLILSPVYLVTALVVKLSSPGPVFYAQERVGYHGRPFRMHKFRSMYIDAEQQGPALSKDNDPRITPFGRFMRKVRLDEIPQFWNVLRGTMSIVGPRPERQYYIDQIVKRAPEYLLLQRVKPGITSWGQVKYGYASNVDEMIERLRYDLLYLDNMSLTTDLKIMVYTVKIIVQGRGK
ncbi:MAG: sugar transferase [Bacteroidales bacterium]|nr:sugar transferase [Bacteroidales bacterium]